MRGQQEARGGIRKFALKIRAGIIAGIPPVILVMPCGHGAGIIAGIRA